MRRLLVIAASLASLGCAAFWVVTMPKTLPPDQLATLSGDAIQGEQVFWAAGCASCHMAEGAKGDAVLVLSGGQRFVSDFGTFLAPNISPDPDHGIGGWSLVDFANAVTKGVSPQGTHYYPAFPYNAYNKMHLQDVADLKAYMDRLPASSAASLPHDVGFPFNIRRILGGWKFLFETTDWTISGDLSEAEIRGRYLSEALAHCAECHTPRNGLGGLKREKWLAGAADPSGKGRIPNITSAALDWSPEDIVSYLTTGFTPEYDSVGGLMAHVVENMARLPESDRASIVAYLKRVPAVSN